MSYIFFLSLQDPAAGALPLPLTRGFNSSLPNLSLAQMEALEAAAGAEGQVSPAELRARLASMYGLPYNSPVLSGVPMYPIPTCK